MNRHSYHWVGCLCWVCCLCDSLLSFCFVSNCQIITETEKNCLSDKTVNMKLRGLVFPIHSCLLPLLVPVGLPLHHTFAPPACRWRCKWREHHQLLYLPESKHHHLHHHHHHHCHHWQHQQPNKSMHAMVIIRKEGSDIIITTNLRLEFLSIWCNKPLILPSCSPLR